MKPISRERLHALAVSKGARVEHGGRSFNDGMARGKAAERAPEAPKPQPTPEPTQIDTAPLVEAVEALRAGQESAAQDIALANQHLVSTIERILVTSQAKPKTSWRLDIERDGDQRISAVIAHPIVKGN